MTWTNTKPCIAIYFLVMRNNEFHWYRRATLYWVNRREAHSSTEKAPFEKLGWKCTLQVGIGLSRLLTLPNFLGTNPFQFTRPILICITYMTVNQYFYSVWPRTAREIHVGERLFWVPLPLPHRGSKRKIPEQNTNNSYNKLLTILLRNNNRNNGRPSISTQHYR